MEWRTKPIDTAFVVANFIGGIGSVLAGILWERGGWSLTMPGASLLIVFALLAWATRRIELAGK
ncbi:hypothetical protein [Rhizobium tumorigenes]|uniref:hypothetical protein n=1 Tax=Rhizobium tumorigenes TaxID=2041385 RepID=UPI00241E4C22|nr:hypothetical protein [Rhizobium tumorigenes]WFS03253.1 hypothetical protein PR016_21625 [Rhizobium tumorigenes]